MSKHDIEIVVEDPTAPAEDSPPVVTTRSVDMAVMVLLIGIAGLMAFDNWRTGASWASDGPQPGYFPFYLSILLGAASLYGLVWSFLSRKEAEDTFVTRAQAWRVLQVFLPTLAFCILTQWLGLYVASFLLIAGFMGLIGRIAWWKSILTAFLFSVIMFVTFEIAFDVIMPKGPLESLFGY